MGLKPQPSLTSQSGYFCSSSCLCPLQESAHEALPSIPFLSSCGSSSYQTSLSRSSMRESAPSSSPSRTSTFSLSSSCFESKYSSSSRLNSTSSSLDSRSLKRSSGSSLSVSSIFCLISSSASSSSSKRFSNGCTLRDFCIDSSLSRTLLIGGKG